MSTNPVPRQLARAEAMAGAAASALPRSGWALRGLFFIALLFAVREARPLLAPLFIAVLLTFALAPAVRWLRARAACRPCSRRCCWSAR